MRGTPGSDLSADVFGKLVVEVEKVDTSAVLNTQRRIFAQNPPGHRIGDIDSDMRTLALFCCASWHHSLTHGFCLPLRERPAGYCARFRVQSCCIKYSIARAA